MAEDWDLRWQQGRIGFHIDSVHPDLIEYGDRLLAGGPHRVFVPLCGKTHDLAWLVERGHEVVGVELVESAVRALHEEQGIEAEVAREEPFTVYRSAGLTVFVGDFFALGREHVGAIDRVWDRASLIALPPSARPGYVEHLRALAGDRWSMLLNVLDYDQSVMDGPPWSVGDDEVRGRYGDLDLERLHERDTIATATRWSDLGHKYWIGRTYAIRMS